MRTNGSTGQFASSWLSEARKFLDLIRSIINLFILYKKRKKFYITLVDYSLLVGEPVSPRNGEPRSADFSYAGDAEKRLYKTI